MKYNLLSATLTGSVILLASAAAAQVPPTARALGMGGAYVATARGHEAIFLNPANLALPGTPFWSIGMPQAAISGTSFGPTLREAGQIAQAGSAEADRRTELLALVPEEGMELGMDARIPFAAIQVGRLGLGVAYGARIDHAVSRDLVDLFVNGYQFGRTDYQTGNTIGSRETYLDFAAAYGARVGSLSVGATAHYLRGRTLSRSQLLEPVFHVSTGELEVEYREVMARGGSGYALDLGVAYAASPDLTASASITGILSKMSWSDQLQTRALIMTGDDFARSSDHWYDRLKEFGSQGDPVDLDSAPASVQVMALGFSDDAGSPRTLNTGLAYRVPATRTQMEISYRRLLSSGRLGHGWDRNLAFGVQQRIPLLVLRAGAATDLADATLVSGGVTLGALELGAARIRENSPTRASGTGWVFSAGLQIRSIASLP